MLTPQFLIMLVVVLIVIGIVWWAITQIPLPPPADWIVRVIFGLVIALFLLSFLTGGFSGGFHGFGRG